MEDPRASSQNQPADLHRAVHLHWDLISLHKQCANRLLCAHNIHTGQQSLLFMLKHMGACNQKELARALHLPVIVHDRDAHADSMEITRRYPDVIGVYHCYAGHVEMARELLKLGYYLSFTGVITFKNAKKAKKVIREVPIERLMIETDSPYMAPEPFRGRRNSSLYVHRMAETIAEIKGISAAEVERITTENGRQLFGISG